MGNNSWEPSLSFGIPRDTPTDNTPDATGLPWEPTPGTSHVAGFRFYDARQHAFLRKFGSGESQLHVRFRNQKTGALTSEYWYLFTNHDQGAEFFAKFKAAAHPGHVIQELTAAGIPYKQQGKF